MEQHVEPLSFVHSLSLFLSVFWYLFQIQDLPFSPVPPSSLSLEHPVTLSAVPCLPRVLRYRNPPLSDLQRLEVELAQITASLADRMLFLLLLLTLPQVSYPSSSAHRLTFAIAKAEVHPSPVQLFLCAKPLKLDNTFDLSESFSLFLCQTMMVRPSIILSFRERASLFCFSLLFSLSNSL